MSDPQGPTSPSQRPHGEIAPEGQAAAQEEALLPRAQSGSMVGYEAAPMGHSGETPSLEVTNHSVLVSRKALPAGDTQRVPVRGTGIVTAEVKGVLQNRLSLANVPVSPKMSTELCFTRSGASAPTGDDDNDDDDARTARRSKGVPGVSGASALGNLQIPSDWGTQETPVADSRYGNNICWHTSWASNLPSPEAQNSRQFRNYFGETSGGAFRAE